MNNRLLRYKLIEFNRTKIRGNSTYIYLDPTINIPGIYNFYMLKLHGWVWCVIRVRVCEGE